MDIKKEHPYEQTDVIMQNLLMLESFHRKVGRLAQQTPVYRQLCSVPLRLFWPEQA